MESIDRGSDLAELLRLGCHVDKFAFGAVLVDPPRCGLDETTLRLVQVLSFLVGFQIPK